MIAAGKSACMALCALFAVGCSVAPGERSFEDLRSAGPASVFDATRDAFSLPMPMLDSAERKRFFVGNSFFNQNWVTAPASTAERDGLGPLFNARSCSTCHFKDGRGRAPEANGEMQTMLLRISVPGADPHGGPAPHPTYGDRIQSSGVAGVAAEGRVLVDYTETSGSYADGERYSLRVPRLQVVDLGYGPTEPELLLSGRVAPALIGLGLLEAVPEAAVLGRVDPDDRDHDGISGRANHVWDAASRSHRLGRFGWKAEQPNLRQQIAAAFLGDMGITSSLVPLEACSPAQRSCALAPSGGTPEIDDDTLDSVLRYVRTLAVPAQRARLPEAAPRGQRLFHRAGCDRCHVETLRTGALQHVPELTGIAIHAYTDLLLHDLGAGLADGRPAFEAGASEFRTAPLWGLGLIQKVNQHTSLLHDGRARNLAEAVLWHGGEAEPARLAFVAMPRADRDALLHFVESL